MKGAVHKVKFRVASASASTVRSRGHGGTGLERSVCVRTVTTEEARRCTGDPGAKHAFQDLGLRDLDAVRTLHSVPTHKVGAWHVGGPVLGASLSQCVCRNGKLLG